MDEKQLEKRLRLVQKEKVSLSKTKLQLDKQEEECIAKLRETECPNPTTQKHFYPYCIRQNAPCESLHTEMEQIQQQQVRYPYQKRFIAQEEFFVLSAAIRYDYLDLVPEIISEEACNYIDQIDGRTALYISVKHGSLQVVQQLLPWMKRETIEVRYTPTQKSALESATGEIKTCIEERLKEITV